MPFYDIAVLEEREIVPGYRARFLHTDNVTIAYWTIEQGAALPVHAHLHEQTTTVLEGKFELTIDGETGVLEAGRMAVIPSNAPHTARALTPCKLIEVFYPIREDYR